MKKVNSQRYRPAHRRVSTLRLERRGRRKRTSILTQLDLLNSLLLHPIPHPRAVHSSAQLKIHGLISRLCYPSSIASFLNLRKFAVDVLFLISPFPRSPLKLDPARRADTYMDNQIRSHPRCRCRGVGLGRVQWWNEGGAGGVGNGKKGGRNVDWARREGSDGRPV